MSSDIEHEKIPDWLREKWRGPDDSVHPLVGCMGTFTDTDGETKACRIVHVHQDGKLCTVLRAGEKRPYRCTILLENFQADAPNKQINRKTTP